MRKRRTVQPFVFALCFAVLAAACSTAPKKYDVRGDADPLINQDANGRPLSVVIRMYQLKDVGNFSRLTFDTLAAGRPEAELLGQDLVDKSEVVIVPGGRYITIDELNNEARYVGIVALFREPDPHYWRYLVDVRTVRSSGLRFKVQDCYLALVDTQPVPIPGQPANARIQCGGRRVASPSGRSYPSHPPSSASRTARPDMSLPDARLGVGVPSGRGASATVDVPLGEATVPININAAPQ